MTLSAGGVSVNTAHSMVSNRKTSTVTDLKGKDKHSMAGKMGFNTSSIDGATGSQVGYYQFTIVDLINAHALISTP